jgi:hypothetical protein
VEYCESPRCKVCVAGSELSGTGTAVGNGDAGKGLWLANAPNVALVGVVGSSRDIG